MIRIWEEVSGGSAEIDLSFIHSLIRSARYYLDTLPSTFPWNFSASEEVENFFPFSKASDGSELFVLRQIKANVTRQVVLAQSMCVQIGKYVSVEVFGININYVSGTQREPIVHLRSMFGTQQLPLLNLEAVDSGVNRVDLILLGSREGEFAIQSRKEFKPNVWTRR
ncbi:MAG: hypothetical protein NZM26_03230 [Patescibacteria group bacterium]|nr:hypothetical protein [Patescibacteria group bacterium]